MRQTRIFRYLCAVALLLMVCVLPLPAKAHSTSLTIPYPGTCQVDLRIHGRGTVTVDNIHYRNITTLSFPKETDLTLVFTPDTGRSLQAVYCNGVRQSCEKHSLTIPELTEDVTIDVYFSGSFWENPTTGDAIMVAFAALLLSGTGLVYLLKKKYKQ